MGGSKWTYHKPTEVIYDGEGERAASLVTPEHASTIIRAVNAHDDLLDMCRTALKDALHQAYPPWEFINDLQAVIAKAQGE